MPRIVSFLPSATEIACALGLADSLVGITHECDYPEGITSKPVLIESCLGDYSKMSPVEIDTKIRETVSTGSEGGPVPGGEFPGASAGDGGQPPAGGGVASGPVG